MYVRGRPTKGGSRRVKSVICSRQQREEKVERRGAINLSGDRFRPADLLVLILLRSWKKMWNQSSHWVPLLPTDLKPLFLTTHFHLMSPPRNIQYSIDTFFNLNTALIQNRADLTSCSLHPFSSPSLPHQMMAGWKCQFIYNDLGPFNVPLSHPNGTTAKLFHSVCNNLGAILNKMAESLKHPDISGLASVE